MVRRIIVLGGGTAGFTAALTLKRLLPALEVTVVRSPDIGIIGVGEGTNITFAQHFIDRLKLPVPRLVELIQPTLKLGLRLLWGPRPEFFYAFATEHAARLPALKRAHAAYVEETPRWTGPVSALMAHEKAFHRGPDRRPRPHRNYAFHVENHKLATGLETLCLEEGVTIRDATVDRVERDDSGVTALVTACGQRLTADLFVDASGFRSELLGRTLGEPWRSFRSSLFCDRAVIGGWERTDEPVSPYTLVETMAAGWCWRIEHESFINRGYVYSTGFISDDAARVEFLSRNPKIPADRTRVVPFVTGRFERSWVGNVVAIGNASGFVEPLEATAIQVICSQSATLAGALEEGSFARLRHARIARRPARGTVIPIEPGSATSAARSPDRASVLLQREHTQRGRLHIGESDALPVRRVIGDEAAIVMLPRQHLTTHRLGLRKIKTPATRRHQRERQLVGGIPLRHRHHRIGKPPAVPLRPRRRKMRRRRRPVLFRHGRQQPQIGIRLPPRKNLRGHHLGFDDLVTRARHLPQLIPSERQRCLRLAQHNLNLARFLHAVCPDRRTNPGGQLRMRRPQHRRRQIIVMIQPVRRRTAELRQQAKLRIHHPGQKRPGAPHHHRPIPGVAQDLAPGRRLSIRRPHPPTTQHHAASSRHPSSSCHHARYLGRQIPSRQALPGQRHPHPHPRTRAAASPGQIVTREAAARFVPDEHARVMEDRDVSQRGVAGTLRHGGVIRGRPQVAHFNQSLPCGP